MSQLLTIVFGDWHKTGQLDLEAVEMLVRGCMHQAGASALSRLLSLTCDRAGEVPCACGQSARYHDTRAKQLLTVLGPVTMQRPYYVCPHCHQGQCPRDEELDVEGTECSPGVRRMMAVVGSDSSFDQGRLQLELLADLTVTTKAVERHAEAIGQQIAQQERLKMQRAVQLDLPEILSSDVKVLYIEMDGTQVPMVRSELEGRTGRVEGQPARTREVKLGCVCTQTTTDEKGRPIRDEDSTTYVGGIETAELFGRHIYVEAWERGWSRAQMKVILGDGAEWIWNIADQHFPGAVQIVDLFHARQHLWELARALFPSQDARQKRWVMRQQNNLDAGRIEKLVSFLRTMEVPTVELAKTIQLEADYFERNAERMRYPAFRCQHLFVGSGVIEAGCKTVIASRLKRSGMFWTVDGANAIITLRCTRLSRKFEDYWATRSWAA